MFDEAMSDRAEAFPLLKLHGTQSPPDVAVQGPEIPADVFGAGGAQEAIQHNRYAFSGLMPVSSMRSPFVAPTSAPRSLLGLLGPPSLWARPLAGFSAVSKFSCSRLRCSPAVVAFLPAAETRLGRAADSQLGVGTMSPTALHVRPGAVGGGGERRGRSRRAALPRRTARACIAKALGMGTWSG
jgi:hypothetical protein